MTANREITVIGLGQMGSALATALVESGHRVTVWNRSADKARPLVEQGARLADTPEEAVAASPQVIACVLDYPAVHTVLDPVVGSLTGKALVNLTSGSPEQARKMATWADSHGIDYLDGAIMTTPPGVGNPDMMFLYSGPREVFEARQPTLAALGDPLYLDTDPGLASLYDVALLGVMWSTMTGWLHGSALVTAEKMPAADFTLVANRWLTTVATFLTRYASQLDAGHYPGDDATVDVQIATIDHLIHAATDRGVDNALPELLKATMKRASAAGHGSSSYASLIEILRTSGGIR